MIETQKHIRKPLYVDAVRITNANFDEIAAWCQGEIEQEEGTKKYIKVRVHNPKNPRQTKAFVGDWLLYTERGYKVYTNKAFHASFDLVDGVQTPPTPIEEVANTTTVEAPQPPTEQVMIERATPQGIADAVAQNEQARMAEGKTVITLEEQEEMDQEEIRELLKSGEYILAQDLAA